MEQLHWVRYRCRALLADDPARGWYSPADGLPTKSSRDAHTSKHRPSGLRRTVFARHGSHQHEYEAVCKGYKGNVIRTTKYSFLTFIPMNLFQQFHRSDQHFGKCFKGLANVEFITLTYLIPVHDTVFPSVPIRTTWGEPDNNSSLVSPAVLSKTTSVTPDFRSQVNLL